MEVVNYSNYLIYPDGKIYNQKYKKYIKARMGTTGYWFVSLWKITKKKIINYTD